MVRQDERWPLERRNLVEAGNPLPWLDAGPLPGPDQLDIDIREPHTVSDYLTNGDVIKDSFIPGLHESFGDLWPLILVAVIGGFLLAIFRGRTPIVRMLGFVALFSGIAYLLTPLTAAGPLDHPTAFTTNLRYASPALGLGAVLLAVDRSFNPWRAQGWLLGILAVLLVTQALPLWDIGDDVWEGDFLFGGIVLAFFVVLVPVVLVLAGQRGASPVGLCWGQRSRRPRSRVRPPSSSTSAAPARRAVPTRSSCGACSSRASAMTLSSPGRRCGLPCRSRVTRLITTV